MQVGNRCRFTLLHGLSRRGQGGAHAVAGDAVLDEVFRIVLPGGELRIGNKVEGLPAYEFLNTESESFARYADARANRRDDFFIRPAGGADICNIPVPVRRVK